jgi:hypothetical protein
MLQAPVALGNRSPRRVRPTRPPAAESQARRPQAHRGHGEGSGRTRARGDQPGATVLLEPAHGTKPRLETTVVSLDAVVAYLSVRCHAAGSSSSSTCGYVGARSVTTSTGATLVVPIVRTSRPPAIGPRRCGGMVGGVGQERREAQHPAVDGDMVDRDPALGEQLLDVAVGEAEAQVPADRQHDDVGWEAEASKVRSWNRSRARTARSHAASLAAPQRSQRTQQRLRRRLPAQCNSAASSTATGATRTRTAGSVAGRAERHERTFSLRPAELGR